VTYTASSAFLEALAEAGVSYIFANFGSDHPALLEALAEAKRDGTRVPAVITCPSEFVAMSAADGFARVTGRAQAVVVHVDCGTQSLGGAVHNAARGRCPVLIFAGMSPATQEGEEHGSRGEFIHWLQDVFDQSGIMRGYARYVNELRSSANVKQVVHRALQFAHSAPRGPVYLMATREVMQRGCERVALDSTQWQPVSPAGLAPEAIEAVLHDLESASRPLIVTSYLGRNPEASSELVRLAERLGIGVLESVPSAMNFPPDHELHQGIQWSEPAQNEALAEADVVLVIDSDVPWIPLHNHPRPGARVHHIDLDVLKEAMPLFYIPARVRAKADGATALRQLNAALDARSSTRSFDGRRSYWAARHARVTSGLRDAEHKPSGDITVPHLVAALRERLDDNTIVINESVTSFQLVFQHLGMRWPGSILTSGAGNLGWNGGAALGAKLAAPGKTVVAITGDGSYLFSQPSVVHWMSRAASAPFLTIVLNNRGWKAPRMSMLSQYPDGAGARANDLGIAFDPPPDYGAIAVAAGGAHAAIIRTPDDIAPSLDAALRVVRDERRSAVVDVWLPRITG
jgi:acetolactate synthase-1/2/3 large subunit